MVRDVLVSEIPTVFRTELYAVAAVVGAAMGGNWKYTASPVFGRGNSRSRSLLRTALHRDATRLAASSRAPAGGVEFDRSPIRRK
jgi:uncharacterized membrane protein YeiH